MALGVYNYLLWKTNWLLLKRAKQSLFGFGEEGFVGRPGGSKEIFVSEFFAVFLEEDLGVGI